MINLQREWTGFKDKNGVKVHEGDLLKTTFNPGCPTCGHNRGQEYAEVVFEGGKFCIKGHSQDLSMALESGGESEYIVVGNIYEQKCYYR